MSNNTEALKDLIVINNDRIEGYKKAVNETDDTDLKSLFQELADQSSKLKTELQQHYSGTNMPTDETRNDGKLYRVWMDMKTALTGKDRKGVLNSCEYGEDVALKTYDSVLEKRNELPTDVASLVQRQRDELKSSHDNVRALRDSARD
jgi:uncharacterized protein (TIGR02284 family)